MKPIQRDEVLGLGEYEQIRARFRARVIEEKKARRVTISDIMSVAFENRDSVLLQIQEMLRAERISAEHAIKHEIDTYNELVPGPSQLSLTLFVEIADKEKREAELVALAGLESSVFVVVDGERFQAKGEDRSVEGIARTTALHYLKADLSDEARRAIHDRKAKVSIVIDHPRHPREVELQGEVLRSLATDFE